MDLPVITTERLNISLLGPGKEAAMRDFMLRNAAHLAPWEPPPAPQDAASLERWLANCIRSHEEFQAGQAVRLVAALRSDPETILAAANFTQISRGPFQACVLGYKVDQAHQGQGLMRECLETGIGYLFNEQRLHRIHANYRPNNLRSGRLLARLGFVIEGFAKDYLFIDGAWRDHVLTSRTNPASGFKPSA